MNDYPNNWHEIAHAVKEAAGWKCERCGVKHEVVCPECQGFGGAVAAYNGLWRKCPTCDGKGQRERILTVHHLDGNKANCEPWNLAALCQRCHLSIQARVDFYQMYMFEHSPWMKRHVDQFTAWLKDRETSGLPMKEATPC